MKTQHPDIKELERFAFDRYSLPNERADTIAGHLECCAYCRDGLGEIIELQRCMEQVDKELVARETARIMRLIPDAGKPARNQIVLHFRPLPPIEAQSAGYALAAKSEESRADYLPIATLYSDDGHTLLRILHETGRASYFFQLMSEDTRNVPHALLVAPGKNPLITDVEGALRVSDTELDIVQIASMSVFYPLDRMRAGRVTTDDLVSHEGMILASDDSTVRLHGDADGLDVLVRWHGSDATPPRYCAAIGQDVHAVGLIEQEHAHLPLTSLPDDSMVLLY